MARKVDQGFDITIIGAGLLGLCTAYALSQQHPGLRLLIIEKEAEVALHQSGHNSGVIHSGIYYRPGSAKARLCAEGARLLYRFCEEHRVPHRRTGKLIVAVSDEERARLGALYENGLKNGLAGLRLLSAEEAREHEPRCQCVAAILCPQTGVVDFVEVARVLARMLSQRGVTLLLRCGLLQVRQRQGGLLLRTTGGEIPSRYVISCAGLHSDQVARMSGASPQARIVPFRGEYYHLHKEGLVQGLIYPVPDPALPFLGVHFTRTIHGEVEAGPNAVLALSREGYRWSALSMADLSELLSHRGFWAMARRHARVGLYELYRSLSKAAFVRSLQRLVPEVRAEDLARSGAGVRAQAVAQDGTLLDDFHIEASERAIHVLNAPSPAATASLAIGRHIAGMATAHFPLSYSTLHTG